MFEGSVCSSPSPNYILMQGGNLVVKSFLLTQSFLETYCEKTGQREIAVCYRVCCIFPGSESEYPILIPFQGPSRSLEVWLIEDSPHLYPTLLGKAWDDSPLQLGVWSPPMEALASSVSFWPCTMSCGILVPQPGIEPPALEARSLNH